MTPLHTDTIAALCTPAAQSAVSVIRISGPDTFTLFTPLWQGRTLADIPARHASLGHIIDPATHETIDQVIITKYTAPASFTGQDTIEIACHGSTYIQQTILSLLATQGIRPAQGGEFSQRAFLNGKIDLTQAEAIADLISSQSKAQHHIAFSQLKGHFAKSLETLRQNLLTFASLIELELDFSQEDVTFADRTHLLTLATDTLTQITRLAATFAQGNALRQGIPIAIAGTTNAGKSTLLNTLLADDKAITSPIPGTTRDTIDGTLQIGGITYRLTDTAGIRQTTDTIEALGIDRTHRAISQASIILWLIDPTQPIDHQTQTLQQHIAAHPDTPIILIINKTDITTYNPINLSTYQQIIATHHITATDPTTIQPVIDTITAQTTLPQENDIIITNARHHHALLQAAHSLRRVIDGLQTELPADLLAQDIREAIHHLGQITGRITSTDILHTIFSSFCIGK